MELQPSDLVGCRYRQVQRNRHRGTPSSAAGQQRADRLRAARAEVFALLPHTPALGDRKRFLRLDIEPGESAEFDTLEALAAGAELITGAVFRSRSEGIGWYLEVDALARMADGNYLPVIVSNHRVARPRVGAAMPAISTARLGLAKPTQLPYQQRHHAVDGYRLSLAARALAEVGLDSGWGAAVGQDRGKVFLAPSGVHQQALDTALQLTPPQQARRVKECDSCRFWQFCAPELEAADEISLFLSGDRAKSYRERGIHTVQALIEADLGEPSALARAWREGIPVLRRRTALQAPRAAVEIDIDVEAYLDQGAYLWGVFDGRDYLPFCTWDGLGGAAEAENFARFWTWLMARREQAAEQGQSFAAYCYSAHGENHWLLGSARRFAGQRFGEFRVPTEDEVREFIGSAQWIDMFKLVKEQLLGPGGLGLKIVAPAAGFQWEESDFDGEESVNAYRRAVGEDPDESERARAQLLSYNGDDCRATAVVRAWLAAGAPGTPLLDEVGGN
ncbi:TM0106 family RecB-like putative nuclease [Corynebacterium sp. A21]|uniref:TM0106 family RecB-like putative nuclease n=1 Tax=Corynebacterium sp. A21 TaxID=3457318 RepID=UPI003FD1EB54